MQCTKLQTIINIQTFLCIYVLFLILLNLLPDVFIQLFYSYKINIRKQKYIIDFERKI